MPINCNRSSAIDWLTLRRRTGLIALTVPATVRTIPLIQFNPQLGDDLGLGYVMGRGASTGVVVPAPISAGPPAAVGAG